MRLLGFAVIAASIAHGAAAQETAPAAAPAPRTLILAELVRDALTQNLPLLVARSNTSASETDITGAKSIFDPRLDFTPSYTRTNQALRVAGDEITGVAPNNIYTGGVGGTLPIGTDYSARFTSNRLAQNNPAFLAPGGLTPSVNNTLTFGVSQPLLRGAWPRYTKAPIEIARFGAESSGARLARTTEQTIADVEIAYWSLGLAEAIERLSRDSYDRARELLARNQRLLELELISELDVITSRRGEQQRLTSLTEATRRRQDAADRLFFVVYGRRASEYLADIDSVTTQEPPAAAPAVPAVAELEQAALATRADLRSAKLDLSQRELVSDVSHNALLPDLRLDLTYGLAVLGTDSIGRFFDPSRDGDLSQRDWKFGFSVAYPIGNRQAKAAEARARYDVEAQSSNVAAVENFVRSEVRASSRAIDANQRRLAQAQKSLDYARQQYDAGQKQLQLGLLDSFRLLQMEEDVTSADLVLQQTRYDLALAITDFDLANGSIDQKYPAQVR